MLVVELDQAARITEQCVWVALQRGQIGLIMRPGNIELEPRLVLASHHRLGCAALGINSM